MTQTVLLGDLVDISSSKRIFYKEYVISGVPFYRSKEIIERAAGRRDISTELFISQERFDEIESKFGAPQEGDLLLTSVGTLGIPYLVQKNEKFYFKDGNLTWFRNFKPALDSQYLLYWLISQDGKNELLNHTIGSTQKALTIQGLKKVRIPLPALETQKKIADILGTIDEKIELNRRMNDSMEQMGQALFRHYFIDNPEAKTWGKTAVGDKIKPRRGKSLQSKNMKPGDVPVVSGGLQPAGLHDESNTVAPVITVSASGANAGFTALWGESVWSADSSYIDTTITSYVYFYYILLSRNQKRTYEMQTGSGQPHIYPSHIELLEMPDAPDAVIARFNDDVAANFMKIAENKKEVQALTTLRDTLLPRLISGKVKV